MIKIKMNYNNVTFARFMVALFLSAIMLVHRAETYGNEGHVVNKKNVKQGRLEVICGSMFAGKSEEIIHRLRDAEDAGEKVVAFKSSLDNRYDLTDIVSHSKSSYRAHAITSLDQVVTLIDQIGAMVVCIDEIQFFSPDALAVIQSLIAQGKRVIVAGLDLDFRGIPFGIMPQLLALADDVLKLHAICDVCGADAHFSQRLINGKPANYDDPIIMVGADQVYQARCRDCYVIDKKPDWSLL